MNSTQNGPSDPSREAQGSAQEGTWRQVWKPEACAADGGAAREEGKLRVLTVENSSEIRGPHSVCASHTDDLIAFLKTYRKLDTEYVGIQIATKPQNILDRKILENCPIPDNIDFLYARLFLKKHPPFEK